MTIGRLPGLVLWAMSLGAPAWGQAGTVGGTVVDDRTDRPISGVLVYVDTHSAAAETDVNGRFTLMAARGRHTVTASVIGYALLQTEVEVGDMPIELTIRLLEGAGTHAERVTVAGSLRDE